MVRVREMLLGTSVSQPEHPEKDAVGESIRLSTMSVSLICPSLSQLLLISSDETVYLNFLLWVVLMFLCFNSWTGSRTRKNAGRDSYLLPADQDAEWCIYLLQILGDIAMALCSFETLDLFLDHGHPSTGRGQDFSGCFQVCSDFVR